MAGISRSRQRPPSIVKPLVASPQYFPGRTAIPPRASPPLKASSTAQHDLARSSLRLFRELCHLDSLLTTPRHAQFQVLGGIVTKTRRKRRFAKIPQAIVQQTRKCFLFGLWGLLAMSNVPRPGWPFARFTEHHCSLFFFIPQGARYSVHPKSSAKLG